MAGVEREDVRLGDVRLLGELLLEPVDGRLPVAAEEPEHQTEGPHVLGPPRVLGAEAELGDRVQRELGDVEIQQSVGIGAAVLERVRVVAGLLQVPLGEGAGVHHQQPPALELGEVHLQRRRVHRHQHVRRVAGGEDVVVGEVDLEAGDAVGGAGGRPDLRREVGEGREVVAHQGGRGGELVAGQLHAVAGVAGEADDDRVQHLARKRRCRSRSVGFFDVAHVRVLYEGAGARSTGNFPVHDARSRTICPMTARRQ